MKTRKNAITMPLSLRVGILSLALLTSMGEAGGGGSLGVKQAESDKNLVLLVDVYDTTVSEVRYER